MIPLSAIVTAVVFRLILLVLILILIFVLVLVLILIMILVLIVLHDLSPFANMPPFERICKSSMRRKSSIIHVSAENDFESIPPIGSNMP